MTLIFGLAQFSDSDSDNMAILKKNIRPLGVFFGATFEKWVLQHGDADGGVIVSVLGNDLLQEI